MRISLAQLNPVVGDVRGNLERMLATVESCHREGTDLVVLPELCLTGYPPRDLLERRWFIDRVVEGVKEMTAASREWGDTGLVFGAPQRTGRDTGRGLYNSAIMVQGGKVAHVSHKSLLPNYDVFDEARYFDVAPSVEPTPFRGESLGISICEDAWNDPVLWPERHYPIDPQGLLVAGGATMLVNISASPFHVGKEEVRFRMFQRHARRFGVPFVFVNQVGGNDELVFDGRSMCLDGRGEPVLLMPAFEEAVVTLELDGHTEPVEYVPLPRIASVHDGLMLGLRDYVRKCGFATAVVGISGGIDSAVVVALAQRALGAGNVVGITMPGPYSSPGSVADSRRLAANLGIDLLEIPITPIHEAYLGQLAGPLDLAGDPGVTVENIQARIRGNILMAFSNRTGHLVLSTGNKSETAVGYCTLYGDMSGGLAVISDVPKTMVYELAAYINSGGEVIPREIVEKPPSAELRPDQRDSDSLPPYDVLDPIIGHYVDEGRSPEAIVAMGFDPSVVHWVARAVDGNEYKRRQAAPGIKVTPKAFGVGRRMPVAARYDRS